MLRQPFPLAMTKKSNNQKPTDSEMNILGVIWKHKSTTVRKVFDDLSKRQNIGYTTVLKLMQIMTDKGLIERDVSVRPQVYRSARPPKKTQRMMLRELVDCAFGGSAGPLVLQALSMQKSSPEELQKIRELLDKMEDKNL
jgi:predicted transcriptional regulator|tara:strand:+ start:109 stop:528 length:420 start_codon:yes stop_codon:yes gene_type:complete